MVMKDRAIAQAVSRRLPTAGARVRAQVRSCEICGRQIGTAAGFLRVHRFPLLILIPPTAPHSSSIIRGWHNRPVSADVPSGLSLTQPPKINNGNELVDMLFSLVCVPLMLFYCRETQKPKITESLRHKLV
jgi:hypothetical protein